MEYEARCDLADPMMSVTATVETREGLRGDSRAWLVGADGGHSGTRRALNLKLEGVTHPEWFVATNVMFDFTKHGYGQSNMVLDPEHWAIIPVINKAGLWRCTYREEGRSPKPRRARWCRSGTSYLRRALRM